MCLYKYTSRLVYQIINFERLTYAEKVEKKASVGSIVERDGIEQINLAWDCLGVSVVFVGEFEGIGGRHDGGILLDRRQGATVEGIAWTVAGDSGGRHATRSVIKCRGVVPMSGIYY
mgnify:CR=1 FL=1